MMVFPACPWLSAKQVLELVEAICRYTSCSNGEHDHADADCQQASAQITHHRMPAAVLSAHLAFCSRPIGVGRAAALAIRWLTA